MILLPDIRSDECSRCLSDNVIVGNVASREVESVIQMQRTGELLAVDKNSIAFCCLGSMARWKF